MLGSLSASSLDFARQPEFHAGLIGGVVGVLACGVVWAIGRAIGRWGAVPIAGVVFAAGSAVALDVRVGLRRDVIAGLVVLALAGGLASVLRFGLPLKLVAATPGAVLLAM